MDDTCKLSQLGITAATKLAALILITPHEEQQNGKDDAKRELGALRQRERPQVASQRPILLRVSALSSQCNQLVQRVLAMLRGLLV